MAAKGAPTGLFILAILLVVGVFLGNQWISQEIEKTGQIPPSSVSAVSATVPQAKDVHTGGQNLVRSESRIEHKKAQLELADPEPEPKKTTPKRMIYEKPLDTKQLLQ